jgi:hypothetical protein
VRLAARDRPQAVTTSDPSHQSPSAAAAPTTGRGEIRTGRFERQATITPRPLLLLGPRQLRSGADDAGHQTNHPE